MPLHVTPILVTLRDFARSLQATTGHPEPSHLWGFITGRLEAQNLSFASGALEQAPEDGEALILLDGLDEIPTREQRAFVRDAVACFVARYPQSRALVTCRTLSYQDLALRLEGVPTFELAPLERAQDRLYSQAAKKLVLLCAVHRSVLHSLLAVGASNHTVLGGFFQLINWTPTCG